MTLDFELAGAALDQAIATLGAMPLPPYIASRRAPDERDRTDYQTIFAQPRRRGRGTDRGPAFHPEAHGSPCGEGHLASFRDAACRRRNLSPGAQCRYQGPCHACRAGLDLGGDRRRAERGEGEGRQDRRRGHHLAQNSGERNERRGQTAALLGSTRIFITPGYRFRFVDRLLTNFHLPRSTLFMLVAAFSGLETMKAAYAHAIERRYRFYSYGDACLLRPETA